MKGFGKRNILLVDAVIVEVLRDLYSFHCHLLLHLAQLSTAHFGLMPFRIILLRGSIRHAMLRP